jgi:hypothetical protein
VSWLEVSALPSLVPSLLRRVLSPAVKSEKSLVWANS